MCELLDWRRPNDRLKTRECRDLLPCLAERDALRMPTKRDGRPAGPSRHPPAAHRSGWCWPRPRSSANTPGHSSRSTTTRAIAHPSALRCYLIQTAEPTPETLGFLQYASPAWRMPARDQWIGWKDHTRRKNLQHLVNQSRFLLLPRVHVPHLAGHVLARSARQLATDWQQHYHVRPLLLETLVDELHDRGTRYRAANWIDVGRTTERGRMDRAHRHHGRAPRRISLYPLVSDARARLANEEPRKELQHHESKRESA